MNVNAFCFILEYFRGSKQQLKKIKRQNEKLLNKLLITVCLYAYTCFMRLVCRA